MFGLVLHTVRYGCRRAGCVGFVGFVGGVIFCIRVLYSGFVFIDRHNNNNGNDNNNTNKRVQRKIQNKCIELS